jgi:pilus biogenesis lipoprotein CpaD
MGKAGLFMNKSWVVMASVLLTTGCSMMDGRMDMQGHDPKAYYDAHPTKNTVARRTLDVNVGFADASAALPARDIASLNNALAPVSRDAVEALNIEVSPTIDKSRQLYLAKVMRQMGVFAKPVFEISAGLENGEAIFHISYVTVQLPDCPNWKSSPVTTYSNTKHSNMGCATTTNLGLMLADPRDLERGASAGHLSPNADRSADAVQRSRTSLSDSASVAAPQPSVALPSSPSQ